MTGRRDGPPEAPRRQAGRDQGAAERERIAGLVGILAAIFGVILVGWIPVAETIRVPFLFTAFVFAWVLGLWVKRVLDARAER